MNIHLKERDSPADKIIRTDSSEVTARVPDENKETLVYV
jgi:hypothetical protein